MVTYAEEHAQEAFEIRQTITELYSLVGESGLTAEESHKATLN